MLSIKPMSSSCIVCKDGRNHEIYARLWEKKPPLHPHLPMGADFMPTPTVGPLLEMAPLLEKFSFIVMID